MTTTASVSVEKATKAPANGRTRASANGKTRQVRQPKALVSFTITPASLDGALITAMQGASQDYDEAPTLHSVAFSVTPKGTPVLLATDRYCMVRARLDVEPKGAKGLDLLAQKPVAISLPDVKSTAAFLKSHYKDAAPTITVSIYETEVHFTHVDKREHRVLRVDGDYPELHRLVEQTRPTTAGDTAAGAFAMSGPGNLAKLGRLGMRIGNSGHFVFSIGASPEKPIGFKAFNGRADLPVFDGLVMPIKLSSVNLTGAEL